MAASAKKDEFLIRINVVICKKKQKKPAKEHCNEHCNDVKHGGRLFNRHFAVKRQNGRQEYCHLLE